MKLRRNDYGGVGSQPLIPTDTTGTRQLVLYRMRDKYLFSSHFGSQTTQFSY